MGSGETKDTSRWMIFIRVITVLGIPVGGWIMRTTMATDKNVAVILSQMQNMDLRIAALERKSQHQDDIYIDDLRSLKRR